MRSRNVDIAYVSPRTLKDTVESVHGFTAVIFQHECDHLDGVLYIDKLQ
jgi:peptide deformylase